jgi:hypothetical protein
MGFKGKIWRFKNVKLKILEYIEEGLAHLQEIKLKLCNQNRIL